MTKGVLARRSQALVAVFEHRPGNARLECQQRREHPQFGVPEHVAVVAQPGQAHRREAVRGAFARERIQVIELQAYLALRLGIALDDDVAMP
jgi:hypothetical protein